MSLEDERIARIVEILKAREAGDDAAVLDAIAGPIVVTVDEQVEGTHFTRALCPFEDVGFRATMAAASDLAAMGARPVAAVSAWVLPRDAREEDIDAIARGQRAACDALGAHVVGGNLARGPVVSIATTWIGTCATPVRRSGARIGDGVYACGALGLAHAGFRALTANVAPRAEAVDAWRRPRALIAEGLAMSTVAHAAIDVSDGLARDAAHLARASSVRIALDESALRKYLHSATIEIASALSADPLDFALDGGEDYALLCASPSPIVGFARIGAIESGEGVTLDGRALSPARGFDHFA
jgi:thiamine-monophosphate kinase